MAEDITPALMFSLYETFVDRTTPINYSSGRHYRPHLWFYEDKQLSSVRVKAWLRRGWVQNVRTMEDGYGGILSLTEEGRDIVESLREASRDQP